MATSESVFGYSLLQVDNGILERHRRLVSAPRSDPYRPSLLLELAGLQTMRRELSHQKGDDDKSITHFTEAVLLPFQPGRKVVNTFFQLASVLYSRFWLYGQPEDIKSSLKYFRFLRNNFHVLEHFDIPHYQLTSRLVRALAQNLKLGFGDVTQDMEEMAALGHELLASDSSGGSRGELRKAIAAFTLAVTETLAQTDSPQHPSERVLQVLREATMIIPDEHTISLALARSHATRFQRRHVIKDYEEAIAIADKIVGAHCLPSSYQEVAIDLIRELVAFRLHSSEDPVFLEDAIHRIRNLLCIPSPPGQTRRCLTTLLYILEEERFGYFGITESSVEGPETFSDFVNDFLSDRSRLLHHVGRQPVDDHYSLLLQNAVDFQGILTSICNCKITDVETVVEYGRTLLPSPDHNISSVIGAVFADILVEAHQRTKRLDYLTEAITLYRNRIRDGTGFDKGHFLAVKGLVFSFISRFKLCHCWQDLEEAMQFYAILADHRYVAVFNRFYFSCSWARRARLHAHHSISAAYEKAMSLMQQSLLFSPTLQTQHFRLANLPGGPEGLPLRFPSDYASYQIEMGQCQQATETLERGKALIWSEMRGLRTSTDKLREVDPALADEFASINRQLESVTMSVAQSENEEIGDSGTGTWHREGVGSIGRLVAKQRRLLEERDTLISRIRSRPSFGKFLKPLSFDALNLAAAHGPVVIINQSEWRSDIIILRKDLSPSIISTPSNLYDRANQLKKQLLRVRKEKGLDSKDYDDTLASVLADLYELVGKLVIERLRQLQVPEKSRIWWCPTSAFCFLPLHAMGPIPSESDDDKKVYFMDLYIPSYTPTLTALIESRKPGSQPEAFDTPSLLLVAQPKTLPGARKEIRVIKAVRTLVTTLVSEKATPTTVISGLRDHQFIHIVCHGLLKTGKPFDASFELHRSNLTLLEIVRSHLPTAEFAFLSACHTAELTDESVPNEGLHLAAAVQFCGFRSVVGTMWAMADTDGAYLSQCFYESIFPESPSPEGAPYYERSARALQVAVEKLRNKRGVTLERWVNFVHYGA